MESIIGYSLKAMRAALWIGGVLIVAAMIMSLAGCFAIGDGSGIGTSFLNFS